VTANRETWDSGLRRNKWGIQPVVFHLEFAVVHENQLAEGFEIEHSLANGRIATEVRT